MSKKKSPSVPDNQKQLLSSDLPFPVVGIGASAGGIQALLRLFELMPANCGMAFVIVTHLSPHHESSLDQILQRSTRMPVRQVTKPVPVEKNHIYLIPPALDLTMNDGYLRLGQPARPRGDRVAIDLFFRTLADVHKTRAIAMVLSGSGADGAVGLARIKEQGGVTLAQAPGDAEFESMPACAIATDKVDFILPIVDMPQKLLELGATITALLQSEVRASVEQSADASPSKPMQLALRAATHSNRT